MKAVETRAGRDGGRPVRAVSGTSLSPTFEMKIRKRHDETAPIDTVRITARTIASARHAIRLKEPGIVILEVRRL